MIKQLRQQLQSWFGQTPPIAPLKAAGSHTNALPWQTADLEVLLFNEVQQQALQIEIPGRSSLFQSWLIGFDLTQNQLLIDTLFPSPPAELLALQSGFKITLIRQQEVLQLWVCLRETLSVANKPALLVDILSKHYRQDRRQHPRVCFERSRGPLCKLQIPMEAQLRGTLVNLSCGGALLNIFGKHTIRQDSFQQNLRVHIQLNDELSLDCQVQIKAAQYYRSPCQHTQLRLKFNALTLDQFQLLDQFISGLRAGEPGAAFNWQDEIAVSKQQQGVMHAIHQRGLEQRSLQQ